MINFMARFNTANFIIGTKTIVGKYFVCSPTEMTINDVGTNYPSSWLGYGTNASFFVPNNPSGIMTAFHIKNNSHIRAQTKRNLADSDKSDLTTRMDYMYYEQDSIGGTNILGISRRVADWVSSPSAIPIGYNYPWIIGGFDLMLQDGTYTTSAALKTALDNRFSQAPNAFSGSITAAGWLPSYNTSTGRTLIGYRSQNEVVFGIFVGGTQASPSNSSGPTVFECHDLMKNYLGCQRALLLDGGGSTQAKWKQSGSDKSYPTSSGRQVFCQIALTPAAAATVSWPP